MQTHKLSLQPMPIENQEATVREIKRTIIGAGGPDDDDKRWPPPWLKRLLEGSFFAQCKFHEPHCNMYCLDCMNSPFCYLCLQDYHKDHHTIRVWRCSHREVVRVSEIQKVLDITGVHTYTINKKKVVFLNERPHQPRHTGKGKGKGATNTCEVCERSLMDSYHRFCSLGCKIEGTSKNFQKKKKQSAAMASDYPYSSNSSSHSRHRNSKVVPGLTPSTAPPTSVNYRTTNKRKGIPHRAPMG